MEQPTRSKQFVEIAITYKHSNYTNTDHLLAEALKGVFEAAEATYRAELDKYSN